MEGGAEKKEAMKAAGKESRGSVSGGEDKGKSDDKNMRTKRDRDAM